MSYVTARNTNTGQVVKVPEHHIDHPVLGRNYVLVDEDAKDYLPELYKAKTAEEFIFSHPSPEENDEDESDDEDGE